MKGRTRLGLVLMSSLALACPDVIRNKVVYTPLPGDDAPMITVKEHMRVVGQAGDGQHLPAGSKWKRVGSIEAGEVYKRADGPFIVESQNAHEAYLVVTNGRIVGFYLPGESAFAPVSQAVPLPPQ
jgi:hypothetical protein